MLRLLAISLCILSAVSSSQLSAQSGRLASDPSRARATRAELKQSAESLRSMASTATDPALRTKYSDQAAMVEERLVTGDLRVGDKVEITIGNDPRWNQTYTVRSGQEIEFTGLATVPLRGVLHAELETHLKQSLQKYFVNQLDLTATPRIRISVSGEVQKPDVHYVLTDAILSDVLTTAGGPTSQANLNKITIQRGEQVLFNPSQASEAYREGWTIDDLQLIGGDQIVVGQRRVTNWLAITQIAASVVGIALAVYGISR